jgi:hypothetical protein
MVRKAVPATPTRGNSPPDFWETHRRASSTRHRRAPSASSRRAFSCCHSRILGRRVLKFRISAGRHDQLRPPRTSMPCPVNGATSVKPGFRQSATRVGSPRGRSSQAERPRRRVRTDKALGDRGSGPLSSDVTHPTFPAVPVPSPSSTAACPRIGGPDELILHPGRHRLVASATSGPSRADNPSGTTSN